MPTRRILRSVRSSETMVVRRVYVLLPSVAKCKLETIYVSFTKKRRSITRKHLEIVLKYTKVVMAQLMVAKRGTHTRRRIQSKKNKNQGEKSRKSKGIKSLKH